MSADANPEPRAERRTGVSSTGKANRKRGRSSEQGIAILMKGRITPTIIPLQYNYGYCIIYSVYLLLLDRIACRLHILYVFIIFKVIIIIIGVSFILMCNFLFIDGCLRQIFFSCIHDKPKTQCIIRWNLYITFVDQAVQPTINQTGATNIINNFGSGSVDGNTMVGKQVNNYRCVSFGFLKA